MKRDDYRHYFANAQPVLIAFRLVVAQQLIAGAFTDLLTLAVKVVNVATAPGQVRVG